MGNKKVLVIGSGGREHALGWKLSQSDEVSEVFYAPGNAGTGQESNSRNVSIDGSEDNFKELADFIEREDVDLTVVGPEQPLVGGLVDFLNDRGYNRVFGPTKRASALEADKFFSYEIMNLIDVPQALSILCYETSQVEDAISRMATEKGVVLKARGLTGGKGVSVFDSSEQALLEINKHAEKYGPHVLVAERLFGQEFSVFAECDGTRVSPLEISIQDHKPLLDDDKGPNTGGMGAYCPAPIASADVVKNVARDIMTPVVCEMKKRGMEYKGFMYAGMIMTEDGPKVIEFNIRFGDPEAQPAMMMLKSDLYKSLSFALEGRLDEVDSEFNPGAACCVVMASQGYPGSYKKGLSITGLDGANAIEGVKVFHAGTRMFGDGVVTSGGRVLGVTGYSPKGLQQAKDLSYEAVRKIFSPENPDAFYCRRDIGEKGLRR
ncbi:phosphoribosylamine--glycine ligase [Candidatus Pacearchaeota archaeon]|nr:phosphoribosylamine--glycine ligase [Candidatus Pacearchaeota archaeon]